jgi:hypothetical protein
MHVFGCGIVAVTAPEALHEMRGRARQWPRDSWRATSLATISRGRVVRSALDIE